MMLDQFIGLIWRLTLTFDGNMAQPLLLKNSAQPPIATDMVEWSGQDYFVLGGSVQYQDPFLLCHHQHHHNCFRI